MRGRGRSNVLVESLGEREMIDSGRKKEEKRIGRLHRREELVGPATFIVVADEISSSFFIRQKVLFRT